MKTNNFFKFARYHLLTLLSALPATSVAGGSQISIAITGIVREVDDMEFILGGAVRPGDTITGIYTYDTSTPDSNSLTTVGDYWHTSPPHGITVTVGGLTFRTDPNNVNFLLEIVNDHAPGIPPTDNYLLRSYNNQFAVSAPDSEFGPPDNHISWQLDDPSAAALSSTDLPAIPPALSDWQSSFGLTILSMGGMGEMFLIRSDVTTATLVEVDSDGDGVSDDKDECTDTPPGAIVDARGCSINQLAPCASPRSGGTWGNHGEYVSAVSQTAETFLTAGLITEEQKDAIVTAAAESDCGR